MELSAEGSGMKFSFGEFKTEMQKIWEIIICISVNMILSLKKMWTPTGQTLVITFDRHYDR